MQIYAPSNAVNRIRSNSFIKPIIFADVQIREKNIFNLKRVERTKITYIDFCLLFEQYQILLNIDQPRNDYWSINTAIKLHASSRIGVQIFNNYKYTTLLCEISANWHTPFSATSVYVRPLFHSTLRKHLYQFESNFLEYLNDCLSRSESDRRCWARGKPEIAPRHPK